MFESVEVPQKVSCATEDFASTS